jgi:hypothetical protein
LLCGLDSLSKQQPNISQKAKNIKRTQAKIRSGLRSTKQKNAIHTIKTEQDKNETHILATKKHHRIFIRIYDAEDKAVRTIFPDQTG